MIDFIAKYWLEVFFSLIIAVLSGFVKHYYQLWKKEQESQKNEFWSNTKEELKQYNRELLEQKQSLLSSEDARLQEAIKIVKESNENLLRAVLEVQKKQFKTDCKYFLENANNISFEEFENLQDEYEIYKSLGGNGPGHTLFDLIQEKYSSQMMQKYQVDLLSENFGLKAMKNTQSPPLRAQYIPPEFINNRLNINSEGMTHHPQHLEKNQIEHKES